MAGEQGDASDLARLRSIVGLDMRFAWLNAGMVAILVLGELAVLGADTYLGDLLGLSDAAKNGLSYFELFAAAMVLVAWPLAGLAGRLRRRARVRALLWEQARHRLAPGPSPA